MVNGGVNILDEQSCLNPEQRACEGCAGQRRLDLAAGPTLRADRPQAAAGTLHPEERGRLKRRRFPEGLVTKDRKGQLG